MFEDAILRPVLANSAPIIEADQAWASGYDGAGVTVAILDSGVDSQHPFLNGKVVEEACYSSTVAGESQTVCPNGLDEQTGAGSAAPCQLADCYHGTHVAGIAAGNGAGAGQPFSGVAKNAQIMAVQVFSEIIDPTICGGVAPCMGGYASDVIAGLERVYTLAAQRQIAAVNMSLGEGAFTSHCDSEPYKPIIDNLRSIGVATVVASGNSGYRNRVSAPACVSSAVSVGSDRQRRSGLVVLECGVLPLSTCAWRRRLFPRWLVVGSKRSAEPRWLRRMSPARGPLCVKRLRARA